jgi:error-prone DNA polymerase
VWRDRQERFRKALLGGRLLLVKGIVENRDAVVHVIAGEIIDRSEALGGIASQSRDFH